MDDLDSLRLELDGERHCHRKDNEYYQAQLDRLRSAVDLLHEALAFMRSCERSGERGADHLVVLAALEASDERTLPTSGMVKITHGRHCTCSSCAAEGWNLLSDLPSLRRMSLRDQRRLELRLRFLASDAKKAGATTVAASLIRAIYKLDERLGRAVD